MNRPCKLSIDNESCWRLLQNIKLIEHALGKVQEPDVETLQVLQEARWLETLLEAGELVIPKWELALSKVSKSDFANRHPQIKRALLEAASQMRMIECLARQEGMLQRQA